MRSSAFAIIVGAMMLASFLPASAQLAEPRGPRPEVVCGDDRHFVTLTFYIGQNDAARLQEILEVLQSGNMSEAVFFIQPSFLENNIVVGNDAAIEMDAASQTNTFRANRLNSA